MRVVGFTVTCSPGRDAAAGVRQIGPGWVSLVLSMDPGRVVIDVPTVSGGVALTDLDEWLAASRVEPHCADAVVRELRSVA
ncbi:MAG TPA: hypothetical protein VFW64_08745 [Pseudonocardiaceae bacterium]|nr:hypothetical protein [Pseudonocardiaceae bacterium]